MPLPWPDPGLRSQRPDLFSLAHLSRPMLQLSSQFCEVPEILPINFFFALKKYTVKTLSPFGSQFTNCHSLPSSNTYDLFLAYLSIDFLT